MTTRTQKSLLIVAVALTLCAPLAAAEKYQVYLAPMPHNDETQPLIIGSKGAATATLDGDTLTIAGTFTGLAGRATKARLSLSRVPGVPGDAQFDLMLEGDTAGKISGQKKLDASQLAGLRRRKLYIQIDSEKMPSGHLWGWLLEEHEIAGQNVPQKGSGYIPPFA